MMTRFVSPGRCKCQSWLLLVKAFNNEGKCPEGEAALKKSLWCTCNINNIDVTDSLFI